jgi:hypothetical protein
MRECLPRQVDKEKKSEFVADAPPKMAGAAARLYT